MRRDASRRRAENLVKDAAVRRVEEEMRFRAGVRRGIEQADRGELESHSDVKARIERTLRPRWVSGGPRRPVDRLNAG